jgi:hypothetical protein
MPLDLRITAKVPISIIPKIIVDVIRYFIFFIFRLLS